MIPQDSQICLLQQKQYMNIFEKVPYTVEGGKHNVSFTVPSANEFTKYYNENADAMISGKADYQEVLTKTDELLKKALDAQAVADAQGQGK